jgi:hypothetical protein
VYLTWPGVIYMTCKVTHVAFKHFRFHAEGFSMGYTASVTFEEVREERLFSEDVRAFGTWRVNRADYPEELDLSDLGVDEELPATGDDEEVTE